MDKTVPLSNKGFDGSITILKRFIANYLIVEHQTTLPIKE